MNHQIKKTIVIELNEQEAEAVLDELTANDVVCDAMAHLRDTLDEAMNGALSLPLEPTIVKRALKAKAPRDTSKTCAICGQPKRRGHHHVKAGPVVDDAE